jgi:UDP-3-O-[3-hydroxymyristoyl] glucosamine N-acyltransferase LpxD
VGNEVGHTFTYNVKASDIAKFLKAKLHGADFSIEAVKTLDDAAEFSLLFSVNRVTSEFLRDIQYACIITSELPDDVGANAFIITKNPKLAFAKVLAEFFTIKKDSFLGRYTVIHPTAKIGKSVVIGNGCTIGRNVIIGDYTEIRNNVVISENVIMGHHCLIRSNSVIGEEGFGFEYEEDFTPVRIPHLGSVEIGDFVEIGNFTAIARGTLKNTIIQSHVKIDNLVHIAHNCFIGEKSMIIACAEVSGSSEVGSNCWLGVGCSTMQKIKLGNSCLIGIGAVVLEDVPPGAVMAGNPAKLIRMQEKYC